MEFSAEISSRTTIAGVIGWPIEHSRSPAIHNAAFKACGLDWRFVGFAVAPGQAEGAVEAMRVLRFGGLSVTMPHKQDVLASVDQCSDSARLLGAANCLVPANGGVRAENTDGAGFVNSLRDLGVDVAGLRCVVVGAGGAGRAVVLALASAGAREVAVVNRNPQRAAAAALLGGSVGRVGTEAMVADADLVVNATSVGMDDGLLPIDGSRLSAGQVVADLVYQPLMTPLLAVARQRGCTVVDGLGMLVHQAALAFTLWTGESAPIEVMRAAAMSGPS